MRTIINFVTHLKNQRPCLTSTNTSVFKKPLLNLLNIAIIMMRCTSPFAPCKVIQESLGFRIPSCGFRIPYPTTWILDYNYGWIPDPMRWIPDSKAVASGFHRPKLPGFRITLYGAISLPLTIVAKFPSDIVLLMKQINNNNTHKKNKIK